MKRVFIILGVLLSLSACVSSFQEYKPKVYNVNSVEPEVIQSRILDAVNEARTKAGLEEVALNSELETAARKHSEDMSIQNRPWHWGTDGSSPIIRTERTGYKGEFLGELISESYETEIETINAWLADFDAQPIIMDPRVTDIGFSWFQEDNAKIWWTLVTGAGIQITEFERTMYDIETILSEE